MPNQSIGLSNYDPETARIQRQQQLAQMLQEQSQQEIPIQSSGGIQAPISPFSILAKALQAYSARKNADQADTKYTDLQTKRSTQLADMLSKQYQVPGQAAQGIPQTDIAPTQTEVSSGLPGAPSASLTLPGSKADPNLGAISNAAQARPTTPQEQLANSLSMMTSGNPQAQQMGAPLYEQALKQQQSAPYYHSIIAAAPANVQPMLSASLRSGDTGALDKYAATLAGKMTPQAVNQASEVTPEQAGIDPKNMAPGTKLFKKPDGTISVVKTSDMASPGRFGQEVNLAQQRAAATTAALKERNAISDTDAPLLDGAIVGGRLDPNRVNSRTAKIYASILKIDPTADFVTPAGIARMKQNPQLQAKIMTAATIPQMLTNLQNVVGQLDYSNVKAAGGMKKWWLGQTNDPTLAKYGPVRNDLILKITSAMRGIGMSDKATELEDKVNSETMSPQAIKGYIEGQMESLKPMLQMYSGITLRTDGMEPSGLPVAKGTEWPSGTAPAGVPAPAAAHPQDQAAISWARANPNDPRSKAILSANGVH